MISHDKAQALVSARYDELLSPADTRALQQHLAGCAACRQFATETDLLVNGLRSMPQLAPSPRVSRAVRDGLTVSGGSPWGWLGQAIRVAASPGLAVASSLVLVAALAFIIVLAVQPLELDDQPRATISALADVIETPTTVPERTPLLAPTVAPTELAIAAPTQEPTAVPTVRVSTVTPSTVTPPSATEAVPTAQPTRQPIVVREQATEAPAVDTPEPTVAPPAPTVVPPTLQQAEELQAPAEEAAPPTMVETANEAVPAEPTSPPIASTSEGAPFTSEQPVAVEEDSAPPAIPQPTIGPGGPESGAALVPPATEVPVTDTVTSMAEAEAEPELDSEISSAATGPTDAPPTAVTEVAPTAIPTSTPVDIIAAESAPAAPSGGTASGPAEAPQLPERDGNEAIGMNGDSMVAEIQATVQAGLVDDSGPPPVPTSPSTTRGSAADAAPSMMTPAPGAGDTALIGPVGAEITGAPVSEPIITEPEPTLAAAIAEPVTEVAAPIAVETAVPVSETAPIVPGGVSETAPAITDASASGPAELAPTVPVLEEAPVAPQVVGAPEPGWPYIGGGGTQLQSNAGYSALVDGGGVTVYGPDGTPIGWVGSGVPNWSPGGTSLLVTGPDGLGAVWDANAGLIPVERPATAARDVPVGWYGGEPLVQRVYLDGSGRVELRVVPVSGAGGYAIGTATTDSVFGEGVTAAKLSPDGGQISFVSGGQLYIAPVSDPGSASPAG